MRGIYVSQYREVKWPTVAFFAPFFRDFSFRENYPASKQSEFVASNTSILQNTDLNKHFVVRSIQALMKNPLA